MSKLIGFELNKLLRSKKNIVVFVIMLILIFLISDNIVFKAMGYEKYNSYLGASFSSYQSSLRNQGDSSEELPDYLANNDYNGFLNWEINYQQKIIDRLKLHKDNSREDQHIFNIIEADKYWLENNIEPESWGDTDKSVFIFLKFADSFPLWFLPLLLLFVGDIFNKEYQSGSVKLLLTQPYKRTTVALSKYFASVIYSLGALTALLLPMFVGLGIKNGFGDPNTPVEITQSYLTPTIIQPYKFNILVPLWFANILTILLIILAIFAFNAIALFISSIITNRGVTVSILAVAAIAFSYLTFTYLFLPIDGFNIFSIADIQNDLIADFESIDRHVHVTFMDALLSLIAYSALFSTLSVQIVKRKNITT